MSLNDGIQTAVKMGERNKKIIELARNWCAHLEVQQSGGVGLVEIETGLPIGMRSFRCPYANAAGFAGMDLQTIALDFYDRNCAGCDQRQPVRLPNLSALVGERDAHRESAKQSAAAEAEAKNKLMSARAGRRGELSKGCDQTCAGVFEVLDTFDRDPSESNRRLLLATARAGSAHFNSGICEALFDIAGAGDLFRVETCLETLTVVGADGGRCCETALRAFQSHNGYKQAGTVVAKHLHKSHAPLVPAALPAIIELAMPTHGMFPGAGFAGDPSALKRAFQLFPVLVLSAFRSLLRSPQKYLRICACNGARSVIDLEPKIGAELVDEFVNSLGLPDDHYGEEGSAESNVTKVLAEIMLRQPSSTAARIKGASKNSTQEVREALFGVYEEILHLEFDPPEIGESARAVQIAYHEFIALLSERAENSLLLKGISFLRDDALRFPHLFEEHAETLVGAAALIATDLEAPHSTVVAVTLNIYPDPLEEMERQARRQMLHTALDAISEATGIAAASGTGTVGMLLLRTFESIGNEHAYFKAGLVRALGKMGATRVGLPLVIPALYQAMTNQSTLVRAEAAEAYRLVAEDDPDGLPPLLHETFLLLLRDPYVIVHSAAVHALRYVEVPEPLKRRVVMYLAAIIAAYRTSRSDNRLLAECLERFLELAPRKNQSSPDSMTAKAVLLMVSDVDSASAARFLARNGTTLRGTAGLGKLIIKLLTEVSDDHYVVDDLVSELARVPSAEILLISNEFGAAASALESAGNESTDDLLEILTAAGVWSVAEKIARSATSNLSENAWDRPRKLRARLREIAAAIESAAAMGKTDLVTELTQRWIKTESEIRNDDEQNQKKRSPFFGLPISDRVE